jgi:hypothetical protein
VIYFSSVIQLFHNVVLGSYMCDMIMCSSSNLDLDLFS